MIVLGNWNFLKLESTVQGFYIEPLKLPPEGKKKMIKNQHHVLNATLNSIPLSYPRPDHFKTPNFYIKCSAPCVCGVECPHLYIIQVLVHYILGKISWPFMAF